MSHEIDKYIFFHSKYGGTGEKFGFKLIDYKKNSGWIHISQLKKANSVIVTNDKIMFKKSSIFSEPIARIKEGRLLIVTRCNNEGCEVKTENLNRWVKKKDLWGDIN